MISDEERMKATPRLAQGCCNDTHVIDKRGNILQVNSISKKKAKKLLAYKIICMKRALDDIDLLLDYAPVGDGTAKTFARNLKLNKTLYRLQVWEEEDEPEALQLVMDLAIRSLENGASQEIVLAMLKQSRGDRDD
jgi:hypothetical protein|tara:strand:+ start:3055 stop:3462 length:408 start_codon:yes stop_codon:yes gene_type:complete